MNSKLREIIDSSDNIVFFGGAGVSTESGIPDFRSAQGIYSGKHEYPPEVILSHDFFMNNTEAFYDFYRSKMLAPTALPNKAHLALAKLESMGKLKAVITQNIDGLHQLAGSKNVLELHGSVHRNYCMKCGNFYDVSVISESEHVPLCSCTGIIKPDVVLYGEALDNRVVQKSVEYIMNADVLIIGGTSLAVYPAAGLVEYYHGHKLVLINRDPTPLDSRSDFLFTGNIGDILGD